MPPTSVCTNALLTQAQSGAALYERLYASFGHLQEVGYQGHRFPVIIGEIGSQFTSSEDNLTMRDVSNWAQGLPQTGAPHTAVAVRTHMPCHIRAVVTGTLCRRYLQACIQACLCHNGHQEQNGRLLLCKTARRLHCPAGLSWLSSCIVVVCTSAPCHLAICCR